MHPIDHIRSGNNAILTVVNGLFKKRETKDRMICLWAWKIEVWVWYKMLDQELCLIKVKHVEGFIHNSMCIDVVNLK